MKKKICNQCGSEKDISDYYSHKRKSGRTSIDGVCKACFCKNAKKWRENNSEKTKLYCRNHYHKEPEKYKSRNRVENLSEDRKISKYKYTAEWRKNNPEYVHKIGADRRVRKKKNGGSLSTQEWKDILEKYNHTCLCCGAKDKYLEIDHIMPLSLGGRHEASNIQPLCKSCNSKKWAKNIDYRSNNR